MAVRLLQYNMVHSGNRPFSSFPSHMTINDCKLVNKEASVHARDWARCVFVGVCQKHNGHLSLLSYMSDWFYFVAPLCLLHPMLYCHQLIKPKPTVYFTFITTSSLFVVSLVFCFCLKLIHIGLFVGFLWLWSVMEKTQHACVLGKFGPQ